MHIWMVCIYEAHSAFIHTWMCTNALHMLQLECIEAADRFNNQSDSGYK